MMSSGDADDLFSSGEEGKHNVLNFLVDVVAQSYSGMQAERFFEDGECALSCNLSVGLMCHEMADAWLSEDCWKVGNDALQ